MKLVQVLVVLCAVCTMQCGMAQENTMEWEEGMKSPKLALSEAEWIAGHWIGEAFGGSIEEVWTPPLGNSMMFVFKLVVEGKIVFYEIGYIKQVEETLLMELKHFDEHLKGWETKDETVAFKLIKRTENKLFFDGLTFEKISENEMNIYVVVEDKGKEEEIKFSYTRQK